MKKTIIALLALAGVAGASTTQLLDLNSSVTADDALGYLYDSSTGLITDDSNTEGSLLNGYTGDYIQVTMSFTLNLTKAMDVTTNTNLITLNTSNVTNNGKTAGNVGLGLTENSLCTTWTTTAFRTSYASTYETLSNDSAAFVGADGNKYITITMVYNHDEYTKLYTDETQIIYDNKLRSDGNTNLLSVYVNKDYISAVQFTPGIVSTTEAVNVYTVNKEFGGEMKGQLVPEPATATLSLLALAGLAARRRRK